MFFHKIIVFLFLLLPITRVDASDLAKAAENWARTKGEEALAVFSEEAKEIRFEKIDALVTENFDINAIGQFVVGRYWRYMQPDVKDYYLRVFKRYLLANYKSMSLVLSKDVTLQSINVVKTEDDLQDTITVNAKVAIKEVAETVETAETAEAEDGSISLGFRLKKDGEGFKIFDIKIAEVSSLLVYRDRFSQMIKERDDDILWFIEDIDILAEDMEDKIMEKCPACKF